jgi:hypothetical protein
LAERAGISKRKPVGIIPIHFDVPEHYIPLDTFIETANQTRVIIDTLNQQLFDGGLQYEFVVFPPEEGSFLTKLGIVIAGTCTAAWAFILTDPGSEFIRGLTGHGTSHYTYQAGLKLRELLTTIETGGIETGSIEIEDDLAQNEALNRIVVDSTKSFLTMDEHALRRVGVTRQKFHEAYEARNQFYRACAADTEIQAIGFDEAPDFPIKRKDFARLQVALGPKEEAAPDVEWEVEIAALKVTSPNWDMNDDKRPWKGKDHLNRDRFFRIDDVQFWRLVQSKRLDPEIVDIIHAQLAFPKSQRRNGRVLRVLKYNDVVLGDPLDDNALSAVLGAYRKPPRENDLFTPGLIPFQEGDPH